MSNDIVVVYTKADEWENIIPTVVKDSIEACWVQDIYIGRICKLSKNTCSYYAPGCCYHFNGIFFLKASTLGALKMKIVSLLNANYISEFS
jgi:hypothetical protein